jgi:hypothetical protein
METINLSLSAHNLGKRLIIGGRPFVGAIVLHDTAGSGSHNDTLYLAHPGDGRPVSVDFTVERDGSIWQLNPDLNRFCTFHAGRATKLTAGGRVFRNGAVNQVAVGIEISHNANPAKQSPLWPSEQIKSVAELCVYLCAKFELGKEAITTHRQIITDGSRSDPRDFPFDMFWFYFNAAANNPGEDAAPEHADAAAAGLGEAIVYTVVNGDTLFAIAKRYATTIEAIKELNGLSDPSNVIRPGQKLIVKK